MGSQFDAQGKLHNWWSDADRATFMQFAGRLVTQFNGYQALPGHTVNGELTLPENMADLVGLQMAFLAYQQSLQGKPAPVINGLTGEQRFFLSYAQSRRSKVRPEQLKQWLSSDPHAPDEFRINGSMRHVDGFHQAFATKPGDAMYQAPKDRVRIW
jgi:putative endopeptidase